LAFIIGIGHDARSFECPISEHSPGKTGDISSKEWRTWYGRRNFRIFGSTVYV